MKPITILHFTATLFLFAMLSCSNNDDVSESGCYQESGRDVISTVTNVEGVINVQEGCFGIFTITADELLNNNPTRLLAPCNLSEDYQIDGKKVVFSGHIYETFDAEDTCADFFELTDIKSDNQ